MYFLDMDLVCTLYTYFFCLTRFKYLLTLAFYPVHGYI